MSEETPDEYGERISEGQAKRRSGFTRLVGHRDNRGVSARGHVLCLLVSSGSSRRREDSIAADSRRLTDVAIICNMLCKAGGVFDAEIEPANALNYCISRHDMRGAA
jgi:hypothetical protein